MAKLAPVLLFMVPHLHLLCPGHICLSLPQRHLELSCHLAFTYMPPLLLGTALPPNFQLTDSHHPLKPKISICPLSPHHLPPHRSQYVTISHGHYLAVSASVFHARRSQNHSPGSIIQTWGLSFFPTEWVAHPPSFSSHTAYDSGMHTDFMLETSLQSDTG